MGAISISIAAMKAAKPPTVTSRVCPMWLCQSATQITADSAAAASNCVSGVIAAEAIVALIARRRRLWLSTPKRRACAGCALCSRTMRWASTFSSTT